MRHLQRVASPRRRRVFPCLLAAALLVPGAVAQWEPDARLTHDAGDSYTAFNNSHSLAGGPGEVVHAVWYDNRGGRWEVYYKRSADGGTTWEADTCLSNSPNTQDWANPVIAVCGATVHVVWKDERHGAPQIFYKRSLDAGITWSPDTRLSNSTVTPFCRPALSCSGSGVHVAWHDLRDGNEEIYYKRSADGGLSWGADTRLTHETASSALVSVAACGAGVHLAWTDCRNGEGEIYYKRSIDGGITWGSDVRLTAESSLSQCPAIAAADGSVHVAWHDRRGGTPFRIHYKRSADNGDRWGADTLLTPEGLWAEYPSIWAAGSDVHIAWDDTRDLANGDIYYKHSCDGGRSWDPDTRLTPIDFTSSRGPSITAWGAAVHVLWYDLRDGNPEIYYKRNAGGNPSASDESGDTRSGAISVGLTLLPTPFVSAAGVAGLASESFLIHDVTGRAVRISRGDRIGERLTPGVYFAKLLSGSDRDLVRVVNVR